MLINQEDFKEAPLTVTDAYKLYYKLKKKISEVSKSDESTQESPAQRQPVEDVTNSCRLTPLISQTSPHSDPQDAAKSSDSKPVRENENSHESTWGDHLNKSKFCPETPKAEVSQYPRFNYSKLSEKLMKGAKIKIRSSLTRKPSLNLSLNSPKPCSSEIKTEDKIAESKVSTPIDEPIPSKCLFGDVDESETVFNGFKPKIVQNKVPSCKQPFSLRGIASGPSKICNRNVDIQWLDECLAAGNIPSKPSANYDQDIIYSSDDEQSKKSRLPVLKKKLPPSPESSSPPALGVKRKSEDVSVANKKPRMESSINSVQEDTPTEKTGIVENSSVTEHQVTEEVQVKESSVNAVKRERLAR